ncbi:MAG: hypothetical protein J3Q66DRAFT_322279 [Benniella sp.]|nr:MAG: hypothetical protein J3Q66DRAFT_348519 [Benniella sp.]KAK3821008.1 MAG: hypothetical protein J3Q66DRAFT_332440 [Benniella sp.]KAK3828275.1 MAG: hypothetical protein J3Q66DRAFT_322279 [Benniella sp.]
MVVLTRETGLLLVDLCLLAGGPPPGPSSLIDLPTAGKQRIAATFGLGEGSRRRSKEESSLSSTLAIFPRCETCP